MTQSINPKKSLSALEGTKNLRRWAMRWIDKKLSSPNVFWITKFTSFHPANKRDETGISAFSGAYAFHRKFTYKLMQFVVNAVSEGKANWESSHCVARWKRNPHETGADGERQVQVMIVLDVTLTHPTQKRMKARAFQSQARLLTCRILPCVVVKQTKQWTTASFELCHVALLWSSEKANKNKQSSDFFHLFAFFFLPSDGEGCVSGWCRREA